MENKYPTIEEAINQENGQWLKVISVDFFKNQHLSTRRFELFEIRQHIINQLAEGKPSYICSHCKIPVKISGGGDSGGGKQLLHFRHAYKSSDCKYNDSSKYTRDQVLCIKFNGAKEGYLHEYLKNTIANLLENDTNYSPLKVDMEKVVRSEIVSKEWRKPDIRAIYSDKEIVFELQIATTFVDVILARSAFYKQKQSYLIWILDQFSTDLKEQTFSQTDILVSSNYNVFVFDKEMQELSKQENELHLRCHYVYHDIEKNKLSPIKWDSKIVTLTQLHYDQEYRVFCYDTEGKKEELLKEIEVKKEENRQYLYEKYNFQVVPSSNEVDIDYRYQELIAKIKDSENENNFLRLEMEFRQLTDFEMDELSKLIQDDIVEWYMDSFNQAFIRFLLTQERLYINLQLLKIADTTPLLHLLARGFEKDVFYTCLHVFFKRDYCPCLLDKEVIRNNITTILKREKLEGDYIDELEKNSIALQYINLYESDLNHFDILYNYRQRQFILRVLSVLINQIVGTKQKNFSAITNDVIINNIEYSHLFIIAMKSSRGRKNDYGKNGDRLLSIFNRKQANHDLDDIFQAIFPNINWKMNIEDIIANQSS